MPMANVQTIRATMTNLARVDFILRHPDRVGYRSVPGKERISLGMYQVVCWSNPMHWPKQCHRIANSLCADISTQIAVKHAISHQKYDASACQIAGNHAADLIKYGSVLPVRCIRTPAGGK